jgi:hypothetical protein
VETAAHSTTPDDVVCTPAGEPAFVITRTTRGWAVLTPAGAERAADLVEAMSLADLIAEDLGASPEPGRDARRAARGAAPGEPGADPRDQQLADLQRTVDQLEHALATRVSTERAIGVLAVQLGTTPRAAFEQLRRDARSSGRPVHDLAREVLDGLSPTAAPAAVPTSDATAPDVPVPATAPPVESVPQAEPVHPAAPTSRRRVERARRQPVLVEGDR